MSPEGAHTTPKSWGGVPPANPEPRRLASSSASGARAPQSMPVSGVPSAATAAATATAEPATASCCGGAATSIKAAGQPAVVDCQRHLRVTASGSAGASTGTSWHLALGGRACSAATAWREAMAAALPLGHSTARGVPERHGTLPTAGKLFF